MPFVGQLIQGIDDATLTAAQVVLFVAHLRCNAVGRLEADAPDVVC